MGVAVLLPPPRGGVVEETEAAHSRLGSLRLTLGSRAQEESSYPLKEGSAIQGADEHIPHGFACHTAQIRGSVITNKDFEGNPC